MGVAMLLLVTFMKILGAGAKPWETAAAISAHEAQSDVQ